MHAPPCSSWWTVSSRQDDQDFRLHPNRPLRVRDEATAWSQAFKRIIHFARITSRRNRSAQSGQPPRAYNQRCAVRVTYSPNKVAGQWAAHGRYVSRESAVGQESEGQHGFGPDGNEVDIPVTLGRWRRAGDPRLFKLIISPEFGERLDLEKHTRDLMTQMERDLNTKLEWVAINHRNTEHPHVHIALRGIDERGVALRLQREFVKTGIRQHAENLATQQLGYRTRLDAEETQRREVHQARFTSLDRAIRKAGKPATDETVFAVNAGTQSPNVKKRLIVLQEMGLAEQKTSNGWQVQSNFEHILREMQKTADRQKALAAHRALMSGPNMPFQVTDLGKIDHLRGRVLGHGEEESTGRTYMLLEGTDGRVYFIYHNDSIQEQRNSGALKPGYTVALSRVRHQVLCISDKTHGSSPEIGR